MRSFFVVCAREWRSQACPPASKIQNGGTITQSSSSPEVGIRLFLLKKFSRFGVLSGCRRWVKNFFGKKKLWTTLGASFFQTFGCVLSWSTLDLVQIRVPFNEERSFSLDCDLWEKLLLTRSLHLCPTYCEIFARAVIEICVHYAPLARPQWTSPADVQVIHGDGALQLREAVPIHSQIEFHVFVLFTSTDKISGATETSVQKIIDISAIMPRWWAALKAVVKMGSGLRVAVDSKFFDRKWEVYFRNYLHQSHFHRRHLSRWESLVCRLMSSLSQVSRPPNRILCCRHTESS